MFEVISVFRLLLTAERSVLRAVMFEVISVFRLLLTAERSVLRVVMFDQTSPFEVSKLRMFDSTFATEPAVI